MIGRLAFNGIDAATGHYLLPDLSPAEVRRLAQGRPQEIDHLRELEWWQHRATEDFLGPAEGVDPTDLAQAGWGVIFPASSDPAVREALAELLDLRKEQATRVHENHFREFTGKNGFRATDSKSDFLIRHGAAPGQPADPRTVPYYLLVVGGPDEIPFSFQYQMDVQYAVGRIDFDTPQEYANYARSVVVSERGGSPNDRSAAFFGTCNDDDAATTMSARELVRPLAEAFADANPTWNVQTAVGGDATKRHLRELLGGSSTPALLFTATHGAGFPQRHPLRRSRQGALICQEWPGPRNWRGALLEDHYLHSDDIADGANLAGVIAFHFACFGAGTPDFDDFSPEPSGQTAQEPFVASLPKRLLGHPNGGALAVIGHVDRAWGYSFVWPESVRQTEVFRGCLAQIAKGYPIGAAFEGFNLRYAELSTDLTTMLERIKRGWPADDESVAFHWTANNDARDVVILGDPAVRCRPGRTQVAGDEQKTPVRLVVSATREVAPASNTPSLEVANLQVLHTALAASPASGASEPALARLVRSLQAATLALERVAEDLAGLEGTEVVGDVVTGSAQQEVLAIARSALADHIRAVIDGGPK